MVCEVRKCTGHTANKFPLPDLYLPDEILMHLSFGEGHLFYVELYKSLCRTCHKYLITVYTKLIFILSATGNVMYTLLKMFRTRQRNFLQVA